MSTLRLLLLIGLFAFAASCGSGSKVVSPDDGGSEVDLPPGTSTTHVLIEPKEESDLEEIVEETGAEILGPVPGTPYYRVAMPEGMSVSEFMHRVHGDARVVGVEADKGMTSPEGDGSTLPAGGLLVASLIPLQEELLRIGAEAARTRSTGAGVRVAVIDTGLVPHEFVDANVDPDGWDFVDQDDDPTDGPNGQDDDGDGHVDEGYGHGTFVASLILGVAPDVRIVPFRVLDSDAVGRVSNIAAAITRAADHGVHIVNLSVSMNDRMRVLDEAIQSARSRGVFVIASAGNTGEDDVNFPASASQAFSVTAVDAFDVRADFASYGSEIDLVAPGVDLLGAFPSSTGTARWSGSSFSAALVTGGFALLRSIDPAAEARDLLSRLEDTAVPVEALNPDLGGDLGSGRIDLDAATAP